MLPSVTMYMYSRSVSYKSPTIDRFTVVCSVTWPLDGRDVYKTWTGVHGPPHGPGPWTTPWTTPNSQKEIAPVNMKIYWRSGYEKHILVLNTYVLEGLSSNLAGCFECVPDRIAIWNCWNESIGGRNALDLLYLKTSLWTSIYGDATPKQPAITRQTLKDISNKSLCFSYPDLW